MYVFAYIYFLCTLPLVECRLFGVCMYVCVCIYLLFVYTTVGRMPSILKSHSGVFVCVLVV